jgi:serine protease inhibitor
MVRPTPLPRTQATRRKTGLVIGVVLILVALAAFAYRRTGIRCCKPLPESVTPAAESVPFDSARARAADDFGARLLTLVAKESTGENVFISPFSAQLALSMVYNGAAGETRRAMGQSLGIGTATLEDFNRYNAALIRRLSGNHNVTLEIANSLWGKSDVPFAPAFLDRARTDYGAEVASLDLGSQDAMKQINGWVSAKTHQRIPTILDQPSAGVLVLLNAVYFKGTWSKPFDKTDTRDEPFHLASGVTVQRPMMRNSDWYGYVQGRNFQAVRLPYRGNEQSMYVLLPDSGVSVSTLYDQLGSSAAAQWRDMSSVEVNLALPRFRLEYGVDLMTPLAGLGMGVALDSRRADFSGMVPASYLAGQRLYISGATQKTFVEVNEEGTEAAAATKVEVGVTAVAPEFQPKHFIVDRPFLIVIRDDPTGALLFVGQIMDPK